MKNVQYSTTGILACEACPGDVVICVDIQIAPLGYIDATATIVSTPKNACQGILVYNLAYDETQLVDADYALVFSDIIGVFCKGCLTSWILAQLQLLTVNDSPSINLTTNDTFPQTLEGDVILSEDDGNILSIHFDGLFAEASGGGSLTSHQEVMSIGYSLTNSFTNVGLAIAIPEAGTYLLTVCLMWVGSCGDLSQGYAEFRLYDSTNSVVLANSDDQVGPACDVQTLYTKTQLITFAGAATINVQGKTPDSDSHATVISGNVPVPGTSLINYVKVA